MVWSRLIENEKEREIHEAAVRLLRSAKTRKDLRATAELVSLLPDIDWHFLAMNMCGARGRPDYYAVRQKLAWERDPNPYTLSCSADDKEALLRVLESNL